MSSAINSFAHMPPGIPATQPTNPVIEEPLQVDQVTQGATQIQPDGAQQIGAEEQIARNQPASVDSSNTMQFIGELAMHRLSNVERELTDMLRRFDNRSKLHEPILTTIEQLSSAALKGGDLVKEQLSPEQQEAWSQASAEMAKLSPELSEIMSSGYIGSKDIERVRGSLDTIGRRLSTMLETERLQCNIMGLNRSREVQFFFTLIERLHEAMMTALRALSGR